MPKSSLKSPELWKRRLRAPTLASAAGPDGQREERPFTQRSNVRHSVLLAGHETRLWEISEDTGKQQLCVQTFEVLQACKSQHISQTQKPSADLKLRNTDGPMRSFCSYQLPQHTHIHLMEKTGLVLLCPPQNDLKFCCFTSETWWHGATACVRVCRGGMGSVWNFTFLHLITVHTRCSDAPISFHGKYFCSQTNTFWTACMSQCLSI